MTFCVRCGAALPDGASFCGSCGTPVTVAAPPPPTAATTYAPPPPSLTFPPTVQATAAPSLGIAIVALILNILVWPGLGTLIAGDNKGWAQGFLFLFGFVLILTIIGIVIAIPLMIGVWIWGIVSGVRLIEKANQAERARANPPPPTW